MNAEDIADVGEAQIQLGSGPFRARWRKVRSGPVTIWEFWIDERDKPNALPVEGRETTLVINGQTIVPDCRVGRCTPGLAEWTLIVTQGRD
jgi:hypothetical protein